LKSRLFFLSLFFASGISYCPVLSQLLLLLDDILLATSLHTSKGQGVGDAKKGAGRQFDARK
jgi:hypothetical protein